MKSSFLQVQNGSGKTTITRMARSIGVYINANDIKRLSLCSD